MALPNYSIKQVIKGVLKTDEELPLKTELKTYPKGTIILQPGGVFESNYYVVSGIIQFSTISKKDNQEKILEFVFPNEFFGAFSFFFPRPSSLYYIECLTECTLEVIPLKEYSIAIKKSLLLNELSRYILEYWFLKRLQKEREMLIDSAEERYKHLLETRTDIVKQIPVSRVAKYLGIHPDSLSRIRRKTT